MVRAVVEDKQCHEIFFAHILLRPSPLVLQVFQTICGVLQAGVVLYDIEKLLKSS